MEASNLKISLRKDIGKEASRKLRRSGMIPGVFYGSKEETVHIAVDLKELKTAIRAHGGAHPFLKLIPTGEEGEQLKDALAILKDTQLDPLTHNLLHIDLFKIDMDTKLTTEVPVNFVGRPEGVQQGGIFQEIRRNLEITAFPSNIPESIEVDINELTIGDSIHIQDVELPDGCEVDTSVNFTIATVSAPRLVVEEVEEEVEAEEEMVGEEEAAPEGEEATEGESSE
jgi:large subunit ribosomal protein L25